jgi:hypothetical protein
VGRGERLKFHEADQDQSRKRGKLTYSLTPPLMVSGRTPHRPATT